MQSNTGNKIKLGVFVVVGAALLVVGIYFIGQKQRLFTPTIRISAMYKNIDGLQVGNNVRFAGIDVGTVDNIAIMNDTTVQIDMLIDKSITQFIKKDAAASIGSEGLMGDKLVTLSPGSVDAEVVKDGDMIRTGEGSSVEQIMASVKVVADNAAVITGDLADVVGNIKEGKGSIGKLLTDEKVADDLGATVSNLKDGTQGLKENMEAAQHNFLLKGYFNKKEKEEQKKLEEAEKAKKQAEKEAQKQ
ncbi:MAG: MCE family protein [Bacteroidetes bacterium]|nr:MCE family protein [Bacteroidota bacterium]